MNHRKRNEQDLHGIQPRAPFEPMADLLDEAGPNPPRVNNDDDGEEDTTDYEKKVAQVFRGG